MIVISTITNGPYWRSSFEPMLYPTGISFYRPFSYREQWIAPQIFAELQGPNFSVKKWIKSNSEGFFCIRFTGDLVKRLIPVRRVELTHISPGPPIHVYYRLKEFVNYQQVPFPRVFDLTGTAVTNEQLFFNLPDAMFADVPMAAADADDAVWNRILTEFSNPQASYPFNQGNPTFFPRLSAVYDQTSALTPARIGSSPIRGPIYGFALPEKGLNELKLVHLLRTAAAEQAAAEFSYSISAENPGLEFQNREIGIQGAYREHSVQVSAPAKSEAPFFVEWKSTSNVANLELPKLKVPLLVSERWWVPWLQGGYVLVLAVLAYFLIRETKANASSSSLATPLGLFVTAVILPVLVENMKRYLPK